MNMVVIRFSKQIWFWETRRYLSSGHTVVSDGTCGLFKRRADKYVPAMIADDIEAIAAGLGYFRHDFGQ